MNVAGGTADIITYFVLRTAADGTATTGATIANIDLQYVRTGDSPSAKQDAVELGAINGSHEANKAKEVDGTDAPGLYRVDWPDAAFAESYASRTALSVCATVLEPTPALKLVYWGGVWNSVRPLRLL